MPNVTLLRDAARQLGELPKPLKARMLELLIRLAEWPSVALNPYAASWPAIIGCEPVITVCSFASNTATSKWSKSGTATAFTTRTNHDSIATDRGFRAAVRTAARREYERLCAAASEAVPLAGEDLPPLPKPDARWEFPGD